MLRLAKNFSISWFILIIFKISFSVMSRLTFKTVLFLPFTCITKFISSSIKSFLETIGQFILLGHQPICDPANPRGALFSGRTERGPVGWVF